MSSHAQEIGGVRMIQVHPTFLYESLWCLGLLIILLIVAYKGKHYFHGQLFFIYLFGYGLGSAGTVLKEKGKTDSSKEIVQNEYLSLLLETGIVGLLLFLAVIFTTVSSGNLFHRFL